MIYSDQFLGDGLMATPAIKRFKENLSSADTMELVVGTAQYNQIYDETTFGCKVKTTDAWPVEPALGRTVSNSETIIKINAVTTLNWISSHPVNGMMPHYAHGYAAQLGVQLQETFPHYVVSLSESEYEAGREWVDSIRNSHSKKILFCAAQSGTDQSVTNPGRIPDKMLLPHIWNGVIASLASQYYFAFLASGNEKLIELDPGLSSNYTVVVGESIRKVAAGLKAADAVLAIDTGLAHLAAGVDANLITISNANIPNSGASTSSTRGKYRLVGRYPRHISTITVDEITAAVRETV